MSNDRSVDHARPSGGADPDALWDHSLQVLTHAEHAKTIVVNSPVATLATLARDPAGYPYGSLVTFALLAGEPLFLISRLAEHTKNLEEDARASLLVAESGSGNPLALGRVTFVGRVSPVAASEAASAKEAFLLAHPNASGYVDFRDFGFYRMQTEALRYIGGFGRMSFVEIPSFLQAEADPISPIASGIIDHMNQDHAEALVLVAKHRTRAKDATLVRMTGVDRYGFELRVGMPSGERPARVVFDEPIADGESARKAMVRLVVQAREALSGG